MRVWLALAFLRVAPVVAECPEEITDCKPLPGCEAAPVILLDVASGWTGACAGLAENPAKSLEACRTACHDDAQCSVWQWSGEGELMGPHCYMGYPEGQCQSRDDFKANGGQRVQHGAIHLLKDAKGVEVENLRTWQLTETDPAVAQQRCRDGCYSDITCNVWQFLWSGAGTDMECRLEHSPDNVAGNAVPGTDSANKVYAGEFIVHYCPGASFPIWAIVVLCIAALLIVGLIAAAIWKQKQARRNKTRAFHEDGHAFMGTGQQVFVPHLMPMPKVTLGPPVYLQGASPATHVSTTYSYGPITPSPGTSTYSASTYPSYVPQEAFRHGTATPPPMD